MSKAYAESGVNLKFGNDMSKVLYEASKLTWENRQGKYGEISAAHDSFSGTRVWGMDQLKGVPEVEKLVFDQDADGIGTKVEVAQRITRYDTIAHDLFAMACDDSSARGFEPAVLTSVLDVNKFKGHMFHWMGQLASGMVEAAKLAGVAVKGGETAELGKCVGGFGAPWKILQFNWGATVHAIGHKDRIITGQEISPSDSLVAFKEVGFRSNGLSLVRKALPKEYGPFWHNAWSEEVGCKLGQAVLKPSIIYSGLLVDTVGGYDLRKSSRAIIHGAAHITGGGIPEKVGRMLEPTGYGADIYQPYSPPVIMELVQKAADIPDQEAYEVLNMGNGMVVATPEPETLIEVADDHSIKAKVIGTVTKEPGITIRSAGVKTPGSILEYGD
jgi:phosphoribosylformylglycinamidine cyclo-ligase